MKKFRVLILTITLVALTLPQTANAALVPKCAQNTGGCIRIEQLIQVGVNYGKLVLGLSGALALVFFVYGGFLLLTSAGNKTMLDKGRKAIIHATIGLIIIFGAFTAVKLMLQVLDPTGTYDMYLNQAK